MQNPTLQYIASESGLSVVQLHEIISLLQDDYSIRQLAHEYDTTIAMMKWVVNKLQEGDYA